MIYYLFHYTSWDPKQYEVYKDIYNDNDLIIINK